MSGGREEEMGDMKCPLSEHVSELFYQPKYWNMWFICCSNLSRVCNIDLPPSPQAAINQSHMSDDALEELSEAREPRQRDSISIKSTDTDLPKFSSWAAGNQSQLDTDVLTKHVRQMVDVSSPTTSHDHPCCHMTTYHTPPHMQHDPPMPHHMITPLSHMTTPHCHMTILLSDMITPPLCHIT